MPEGGLRSLRGARRAASERAQQIRRDAEHSANREAGPGGNTIAADLLKEEASKMDAKLHAKKF